MSDEVGAARAVFDPIAARYLSRDGVDIGPMFGSEGLRVRGKVFAFVGHRGGLVVKVPQARADELASHPPVEKMRMRDREMREWIFVPLAASDRWEALLAEAYDYLDQITP